MIDTLESSLRISILTEAISESGITGTSNLIDIVKHFSARVCLVSSPEAERYFEHDKNVHTYSLHHKRSKNALIRIARSLFFQTRISYRMLTLMRATDFWLFFIGGDLLVLPMITAKLLRKKVLLVLAGSASETLIFSNKARLASVARLASQLNCTLSNYIVLYSSILIDTWHLERYQHKIIVAGEHFIDFDQLQIKRPFEQRAELVGYLGRLSEEKGILNLIKAIPLITKQRADVKFLIVGDGRLRTEITQYLAINDLDERVSLTGRVEHSRISDYLNQLKLIVLPSYTEGLPNVMLEAMASGVPVLATTAGAITDVIRDGETGFVMERNTPECIAANVMRALEYPHIDQVVDKANAFVKREYSYERIVQNWADIFSVSVDQR